MSIRWRGMRHSLVPNRREVRVAYSIFLFSAERRFESPLHTLLKASPIAAYRVALLKVLVPRTPGGKSCSFGLLFCRNAQMMTALRHGVSQDRTAERSCALTSGAHYIRGSRSSKPRVERCSQGLFGAKDDNKKQFLLPTSLAQDHFLMCLRTDRTTTDALI